MEIFLALLYPLGLGGIITTLLLYLRKQELSQTAASMVRASLKPADDIADGFATVAASMRQLRKAKTEENQLHIDNWEQAFYTEEEYKALLEKRRHEKMLEEGTIKAKELTPTEAKHISAVDREGDEWVPLGYKRKKDPDEDLSYSQRRIQSAGAIVRDAPNDQASSMGAITGNSVWRFDGWVKGKSIAGNNVWFYYIGENSGIFKYVWSGATKDCSTTGMPFGGDHYGHETAMIRAASHVQMPVAEVARRVAQDQAWKQGKKYTEIPKDEIPASTEKVVW